MTHTLDDPPFGWASLGDYLIGWPSHWMTLHLDEPSSNYLLSRWTFLWMTCSLDDLAFRWPALWIYPPLYDPPFGCASLGWPSYCMTLSLYVSVYSLSWMTLHLDEFFFEWPALWMTLSLDDLLFASLGWSSLGWPSIWMRLPWMTLHLEAPPFDDQPFGLLSILDDFAFIDPPLDDPSFGWTSNGWNLNDHPSLFRWLSLWWAALWMTLLFCLPDNIK